MADRCCCQNISVERLRNFTEYKQQHCFPRAAFKKGLKEHNIYKQIQLW
jgi:hypothetical protein